MSEGNGRQRQIPRYTATAGQFLRHVCARFGDHTLVVLNDRRVTYSEMETTSAELAKGMLAIGVGKGTRVGLLAPNGPEWIAAWLAASRIGAVAVLLNTYSKPRELGWVLRHADVSVLLTARSHLGHDYVEHVESLAPGLGQATTEQIVIQSHPFLRRVYTWGDADRPWCSPMTELVAEGAAVGDDVLAAAEEQVAESDPMLVVFSSGSTADPKGVVHDQGPVIAHPYNLLQFRDFRAGDVMYTPMPLFWVGGLAFTLVCGMHAGITLVFEDRFEAGETLELIERERVTHVAGWPHMAKALTEHPTFAERDLASVRNASIDAMLPAALRIGDPELRANSLGMTETLGPHTIELIGSRLADDKRGSFGRTVPGLEHKVVDPVSGEDLPRGELGEICVRGYSLMSGMVKVPREDVFTDGGWYRTGDGGWFDEGGHLFFKGRMGDQIKTSGMNVTPREVEMVLEEHEAVMHAFVMGVPNPDRGSDVAAAVVFKPSMNVDPEELIAMTKNELSSYKVPRHVVTFSDPQDLPWLDSGKIDRRAVERILEERSR